MPYHSTPIKADDLSLDKYYYLCKVRGCGTIINPNFPVGLKSPAPVHCKDCQNKDVRNAIEAEYDTRKNGE